MRNVTENLPNAAAFRAFYESVPEENWMTQDFKNGDDSRRCAVGLVGEVDEAGCMNDSTDNAIRVRKIASSFCISYSMMCINDGACSRYQQETPKARVLAFLDDAVKAGF